MAESAASGNSSQSKSLLWMMIGFFIGLLILVGGGFLLVNRVVRSFGLSAGSNKNTVHTSTGSFRLQKQDQVGPGLPVFPRASLELPDGSATAATIKEAQNGINIATYHTTDIRDYVDNWYSQHLGPEFKRRDSGERPLPEIFKDANVSDSDIAFVAERGSQVRIVALAIDEGGTKISLIRVDKSPAPTSSSPTDK
jgi:hypothetical protein